MTLADELREVAFAAPPKEDFLEEDHDEAPELFLKPDREELRKCEVDENPRFRAAVDLEDIGLEGVPTDRKGTFSEESMSVEEDLPSASSLIVEEEEKQEETKDLYEQINQLNDDVGLSELRKRALKDRERGLIVQRDLKRWNECLDLRIVLQECLLETRRLPSLSNLYHLIDSNELAASKQKEISGICDELLRQLLELESKRLVGKKRKETDGVGDGYGQMWEKIEERYLALSGFRDESLNRYHRQAMLQSGATTKKGKLQILHQSITSQVYAVMQIPKRVLQKYNMPVADVPKVLGQDSPEEDNRDRLNGENFDDQAFFQTLRNESPMDQKVIRIHSKRTRKRFKTRQSGKRLESLFIRVQDKLVNFMTPSEIDEPEFSKQLVQNLFGS